ncbi:MAG: class I SAM-dependent methyltransferase [Promethearchaeota archaeon]
MPTSISSKEIQKKTLPIFVNNHKEKKFDFIFIDGGHSINTIRNDWLNVQKLMTSHTMVIFDDYYHIREDPNFTKSFGCNLIIDELDKKKYEIKLLSPREKFKTKIGNLKINNVRVKLK